MVAEPGGALGVLELDIRPMDSGDLTAVAQLERESYEFPWSEGIFRDSLRVGYYCSVLTFDPIIAGYSVLAVGAGEAHILNVCVRREFRARGLGGRLLDHLIDQARGRPTCRRSGFTIPRASCRSASGAATIRRQVAVKMPSSCVGRSSRRAAARIRVQ